MYLNFRGALYVKLTIFEVYIGSASLVVYTYIHTYVHTCSNISMCGERETGTSKSLSCLRPVGTGVPVRLLIALLKGFTRGPARGNHLLITITFKSLKLHA